MTRRSGHPPAEEDAIRRLTAWLARQFPELSVRDVERAVYGKYRSFDDSAVRDFVPVLVEQASRRELASQRPGRHRA
jgi:hypothetical protein